MTAQTDPEWREATRREPCPVCEHPDWCSLCGPEGAIEAVVCMRIKSDNQRSNEGWLHRLRNKRIDWRPSTHDRPRSKATTKSQPKPGKPTTTHPTLDALVATMRPVPSRVDRYHNRQGELVGAAIRQDHAKGKTVKPGRREGNGTWSLAAMPEPRPLFRLPELIAAPAATVYVVEGEKCAEALRSVGLLATTWPGGSKATGKVDLSPLAGRDVVLLPDHDDPGRAAMQSLVERFEPLTPQPKQLRMVELTTKPNGTDAPNKYDVADWIDDHGADPETIAANLRSLVEAAEPVELVKPEPPKRWHRFPTEQLPDPLRPLVVEGARAIGCDESFVALPGLAACAGAIGATRTVRIKRGWNEPAVLWCVVVSPSGATKSQGRKLILPMLQKRQREALRDYEQQIQDHGVLNLAYEQELKAWKNAKNGEHPPEAPEKPEPVEFFTSDATVEAMVRVLRANPRGVLFEADELAGWVKGFDAYKGGKGADAQHWINLHGAGHIKVNRAGLAAPIFVARAAVSVSGTIQPEVLTAALTGEHTASGFAARLLMAEPPRQQKRWTDHEVSEAVEQAFGDRLADLLDLEFATDAEGESLPVALPLAADARERFKRFVNAHGAEGMQHDGAQAAAWSKLEGYAARLALVMQLIDSPDAMEVSDHWLAAGIELARWFGNEAARFYGGAAESPEELANRKLVAWIESKGGIVTARDLSRGPKPYRGDSDQAEVALRGLAEAGYGTLENVTAKSSGGRPTIRFRLCDDGDSDETPANVGESAGSVTVTSVATPEIEDSAAIDSNGWEAA